ncbi:unnamed protein product [Caenorhabditis nigoni]
MPAIDVVIKGFRLIFPKNENIFVLIAFLWSLFVANRQTPDKNWEQNVINVCKIIRLISIPLFHRYPVNWLFIFTTSSIFSFIIQNKTFIGVTLSVVLHTILYFLLLGLSPLTYWNIGKQFVNLLIWPDDPRQLAFEIGMTFAVGIMTVHFLVHFGEKILEIVRIDWILVTAVFHPIILIYLFSDFLNIVFIGIGYSALVLSMKYQWKHITQTVGIALFFIFIKLLTS